MKKYNLFFDGNLYEVNEEVTRIIKFCKICPQVKEVKNKFSDSDELRQLIENKIISPAGDLFKVADNIIVSEYSPNILAAITFYFGFQCNMSCNHCHSRIIARDKREQMSIEQARYITGEIIKAKPLSVRLGGGEPLMREDFLSVINQFSRAGIAISFTTNGWYLTEEMTRCLSDIKKLDSVRLSIHGIGGGHDAFTNKKNSFKRLMAAQRLLKKHGLNHKFIVVLNSRTKDKIKQLIEMVEDVGASGIHFRTLKIAGNATNDLALSHDEWHKIYQLIKGESEKGRINVNLTLDHAIAKSLGVEEKCLCGRNGLTIRPSGDFSACGTSFDAIGNVFKSSLINDWKSHPKLLKIRRGLCPCEILNNLQKT